MALSLSRKRTPTSPPRAKARGPVGLDLDGGFVAAVQTIDDGVAVAVSADLPRGLMSEGEVLDVAGLSAALKTLFKTHDLSKRVRLGVSNQQIVVRQIELPLIEDPVERAAAVRFQAAEAIAMPLDEAILDYQMIGDAVAEDGSTQLRAIVVAARATMVNRVVEAAREAGLRVESVDLNPFALVRALASPEEDGAARVYCHLGGVTNLAIAVGTSCLFTRPLATFGEEDPEHTAGALAEEIRQSIDYYMNLPEAPPVGEVVLSGPGSMRDGLAEELASLIDLSVSTAEPLGHLTPFEFPEGEDPSRHTVAAGLALGAAA